MVFQTHIIDFIILPIYGAYYPINYPIELLPPVSCSPTIPETAGSKLFYSILLKSPITVDGTLVL